jgi:outer membrane biosynthesis protein TonB
VRKKFLSAVAGATLVLVLATGCQATQPDIAPDQAAAFQSRVLAVTTAVAEGGYAAALETLTALESELNAAAAAGDVTFARHERIEAAMTAVRTDIQAAIDAQSVPEPAPAPVTPVTPVAPREQDEATPTPTPDVETDAEKKIREAADKAAKKAEDARQKAADKAAEEAKKAAEDAKKQAEEDAKDKAKEDAETDQGD